MDKNFEIINLLTGTSEAFTTQTSETLIELKELSYVWYLVYAPDILSEIEKNLNLDDQKLEIVKKCLKTTRKAYYKEHSDMLFFLLNDLNISFETTPLGESKILILLSSNRIYTFQKEADNLFNDIRHRIFELVQNNKSMHPKELFLRIIDSIVDKYSIEVEELEEIIESIEEEIFLNPDKNKTIKLQSVKKTAMLIYRNIESTLDAVIEMEHTDLIIHDQYLKKYLTTIKDHLFKIKDEISHLQDILNNAFSFYLTLVSNQTNEIMKVLAVISTIFLPLTFIVGVYGMNFEYFPEIRWKYGYFLIWGVILATVTMMLFYFRRKKWF